MRRSPPLLRLSRLALPALALALMIAPVRAAPDDADLEGATGWGNVVTYSLCAAGVALAPTPMQLVAALAYCWNLYREAV